MRQRIVWAVGLAGSIGVAWSGTATAQEPEPSKGAAPPASEAAPAPPAEPEGTPAAAQDAPPVSGCPDEDDENHYTEAGSFEVGGSVNGAWTKDSYTIGATPSFGWFPIDRFELSILLGLNYTNVKEDDGSRDGTLVFTSVLEPSYHFPFSDSLYAFAGLGVGAGYDGNHAAFDLIPRVGVNIEIGSGGIFTPAVKVPILVGRSQGSGDDVDVRAGVTLEAGITTTF